ncbi:hypothetical protein OIE66_24960 [Nonomuraea sp. NBC_01738]|nr:hypothetical protein OIE66_24960 [Nonomuraea sp. NBC_01738]
MAEPSRPAAWRARLYGGAPGITALIAERGDAGGVPARFRAGWDCSALSG